jgi:hypothetical protein
MNIPLTEQDRLLAEELAAKTFQRYKNTKGFYRNLRSSHDIGRYGEIGSHKYLVDLGFECEPHYLNADEDNLCDISTPDTRWDVKTWNTKYWNIWGRAVSSKQLPRLEAKADAILWASVDPLTADKVIIYGWNTIEDIKKYEAVWMGPIDTQVHNHQVPLSDIRPLSGIKKEAPPISG